MAENAERVRDGWFVTSDRVVYAIINGSPYQVKAKGTPLERLDPGSYTEEQAQHAMRRAKAASAKVVRVQRWDNERERAEHLIAEKYYGEKPGERDDRGRFGAGGGGGGDGDKAKPAGGGKPVAGFKAGIAGRGNDAAMAAKQGWFKESPFKGKGGDKLRLAMEASHEAQAELGKVGEQIAKDIPGVQFKNPGVKRDEARIKEKAEQRGGAEKVTDLARGGFIVEHPEQATQIADKLAEHFGIAEEDWKPTEVHYADKAMNVRFPNGLVGEIQIMDATMEHAKREVAKGGLGGHDMYVEWRNAMRDGDTAKAEKMLTQQTELYRKITDNYSPAWKAVLGIGGK